MPTYIIRVALGRAWCFQIGDDLDVQHAERLADIEPLARAWVARHDGLSGRAVRLRLQLLPTYRHARP
jgi:hypothetical protein